MDFEKISKQIKSLDRIEKLKILGLLSEEGKKSISAIAKELNIHFSTVHKYLEQLEAAELVQSKTVKEDRFKRYFFVAPFTLNISPETLVSGDVKKGKDTEFSVILNDGSLVNFKGDKFLEKYIAEGLPIMLLKTILSAVLEKKSKKYLTILELEKALNKELKSHAILISSALESIKTKQLQDRDYLGLLKLTHPKIIEKHIAGDLFIHNLEKPVFFNFAHDLRGISLHGISGKAPETLDEMLNHTLTAVSATKDISNIHALNCINYMLAVFIEKLSESEIKQKLTAFFEKLDMLGIKIVLGIDYGNAEYAKKLGTAYYFEAVKQNKAVYAGYDFEAAKLCDILLNIFSSNSFKNMTYVLKCWKKPSFPVASNTLIANMTARWQSENATYIGSARYDSSWKGWMTTNRTGEAQTISINIPKLVENCKEKTEFLAQLENLVKEVIDYLFTIAELGLGSGMRDQKYSFKSVQRGTWDYVLLNDVLFTIALYGIASTGKFKIHPEELLVTIQKTINDNKKSLRVELKEELNENIKNRFAEMLSSKLEELPLQEIIKTHRFLKGGHLIKINKSDLNIFFENEGGLALTY